MYESLLELFIGTYFLSKIRPDDLSYYVLLLSFEFMSFLFGIYLWFLITDKLPTYYDEDQIHVFNDGFFSLYLPGVNINNSNWPHIVKYLRIWSAATMVLLPFPCILPLVLLSGSRWAFVFQMAEIIAYLAGLFVPVYVVGKKYE